MQWASRDYKSQNAALWALAAPPPRVSPHLGAALGTISSRCPHRGRAMETGCWLLGGEFEDSVFEERPERRPGPPASYRAKTCEPQVRGRANSPCPEPPGPGFRGSRRQCPPPPRLPCAHPPPVICNQREARRAQGTPALSRRTGTGVWRASLGRPRLPSPAPTSAVPRCLQCLRPPSAPPKCRRRPLPKP